MERDTKEVKEQLQRSIMMSYGNKMERAIKVGGQHPQYDGIDAIHNNRVTSYVSNVLFFNQNPNLIGIRRTLGAHGNQFVVEGQSHWADKLFAPVGGSILGLIHEEGSQGVDPSDSVEWDDHQNGEESLSDGEEVIVRWFPLDGRKDVKRLFEEERDSVGTHGGLGGFCGGRAGAVEDRNDNDQRECVGSSELGGC